MELKESRDVLLPISLYCDKTGTDSLQRHSLEPFMFTIANLDLSERESWENWRHLGFVPANHELFRNLEECQREKNAKPIL